MRFAAAILFLLVIEGLGRPPQHFKQFDAALKTITTFQTNSTFAPVAGASSTSNTDHIWKGVQSNRLTAPSTSTVLFIQTLAAPVSVCADSFFRVSFFIDNKANVLNLNALTLYVATDLSNFIAYEFGSFGVRDTLLTYWGGWSQYHASRLKFVQTGTFNCASVGTIAIGLKAQSGVDTVTIGEVAGFPRRSPIATLIFNEDDQWDSWRINGVPKLDSLGWRHTIFINGARVGQTNFTKEYQIDSMYRRGLMDVGSHLWTHDSSTDLFDQPLIESLRRNRDYIRSHGWKGYSMLAYPFGKKSRQVDSLVRASGLVDFARLTVGGDGESQQFNDDFNIRLITSLGNTSDTTAVKAGIDSLVKHRTTGIILAHQIGPVGCTEDGNTWCKDHWLSVVNYAKTQVDAGTLRVMSLGDYLSAYGGESGPARRMGMGSN